MLTFRHAAFKMSLTPDMVTLEFLMNGHWKLLESRATPVPVGQLEGSGCLSVFVKGFETAHPSVKLRELLASQG